MLAAGCASKFSSDVSNPVTSVTPTPVSVTAPGVVAWGDSLTQGDKGQIDVNNYPTQLGALLTIPVVNEGISGETSTQIGVREGGVPTYATVQGGVIPASGDVQVTFPTGYEPGIAVGEITTGTILGVHGGVTCVVANGSCTSVYTFTRDTAGSAVSVSGAPQFVVDTPYANYLPVFWEGRNNYLAPAQIISDLTAQIATVPSGMDYLVLSITNDAWEKSGTTGYNDITNDNEKLQTLAGSHYLDIRKILVNDYDPTQANDVGDYNNDIVSTSLRAIWAQVELAQAVGPNDTTVYITPIIRGGFPSFSIDNLLAVDTGTNAEDMFITAAAECDSGSTIPDCAGHTGQDVATVQRGYEGNQTSHAAGTVVLGIDPVHLNGKGTGIIAQAVANYLSAYEIP